MELRVIGDGVSLNRRKEKKVFKKVYSVKHFSYRCSFSPRQLLIMKVDIGQGVSHEILKFVLNSQKTLTLIPLSAYPYVYSICWILGKLNYELYIDNLSVISDLICLNRFFDIKNQLTG